MLNPEDPSAREPDPVPTPRRIRWALVIPAALLLVIILGASAGFLSGQALHSERQAALIHARDTEQFNRAQDDIQAGRFKLAISRLESILLNEPDFPGAAEKRQEALAAINATPTPRPTETPMPSPTPDVSKAEQLFNQAKQQFTDKDYAGMIQTLLTLKVEVPGFQPVRVDGMLWVGLRYNGVHLIKDTSQLTEGLYYLDLAVFYAPLDSEAAAQEKFARTFLALYQGAYYYRTIDIEISMNDFEQVVKLRPYYRDNLIKDYGDILIANAQATGSPCGAVELYAAHAIPQLDNYDAYVKARDQAQRDCDLSRPTAAPVTPTEVPTPVPT